MSQPGFSSGHPCGHADAPDALATVGTEAAPRVGVSGLMVTVGDSGMDGDGVGGAGDGVAVLCSVAEGDGVAVATLVGVRVLVGVAG